MTLFSLALVYFTSPFAVVVDHGSSSKCSCAIIGGTLVDVLGAAVPRHRGSGFFGGGSFSGHRFFQISRFIVQGCLTGSKIDSLVSVISTYIFKALFI